MLDFSAMSPRPNSEFLLLSYVYVKILSVRKCMLSRSVCLFKAGDSPAEEVLHCCWLWLGLSRHRVQRHPSVFPRVSLSKAAADAAD